MTTAQQINIEFDLKISQASVGRTGMLAVLSANVAYVANKTISFS